MLTQSKYLVLVCILSCQSKPITGSNNSTTGFTGDWFPITFNQKKLTLISVERVLYENAGSKYFFLHFQIKNLSQKPIAVDLRNYWNVPFPNQWSASKVNHRQVIDERRMMTRSVDKASVIAAFKAGQLSTIPPERVLDYYRDFNASGRKDVDAQNKTESFLIISLGGELVVTDGNLVEQQNLSTPFTPEKTDLVFSFPLTWKKIPNGALVLTNGL